MSSIFGLLISFVGWFYIPDATHLRPWVIGFGVTALLSSSYRAWHIENAARYKAEMEFDKERLLRDGPDVIVEVLPHGPMGSLVLGFKSIGKQTATCIEFTPLQDNLELSATPRVVPILEPGLRAHVEVLVSSPPATDRAGTTILLLQYLMSSAPLPLVMHVKFKDALGKKIFVREFSVKGNRNGIAFMPASIKLL